MASHGHSGAVSGLDGVPVLVEVDLLRRLPAMVIVGLPHASVRESSDRVRSAILAAGCEFPRFRVVVNLAPAHLRKEGTAFDLPIAIGILVASEQVPKDATEGSVFIGELSLDGQLRPVRGVLPLAWMARAAGFGRVVVARESAAEARLVEGLEVLCASRLEEVVAWLRGDGSLVDARSVSDSRFDRPALSSRDLREVRGQAFARRALEVAAAGGHNILFVGAPGGGKTLLASALPSLLPPLDPDEALEVTRIHSAAGLLEGGGLVVERPFRAPHHTVTVAGMLGGASLRPGEVALAHRGVLFLDELPEFGRVVLEMLRGPLEDRAVVLGRAAGVVRYPASFALVGAANPCPCGFLGHPTRGCTCGPLQVERYQSRLSGPLLDRIDVRVAVAPVDPDALLHGQAPEDSATVQRRVAAARDRQARRWGVARTNAEMTGDVLASLALNGEVRAALRSAMSRLGLSARGVVRAARVARTIADLDGCDVIQRPHVMEALALRVSVGAEGECRAA